MAHSESVIATDLIKSGWSHGGVAASASGHVFVSSRHVTLQKNIRK